MLRNAVELSHYYAAAAAGEGSICVDATAGNGNDTVFLAELVGESGRVYAFDVQERALSKTRQKLAERGLLGRVELILDSHAAMEKYVSGQVDVIMFNLGRLPGSDHTVYTKEESTIAAIDAGLDLLKPGGLICIAAYWGDPICCAEYRAVYEYLKMLDPGKAEVLFHEYINEPNCPPTFFVVCKS